MIKRAWTYGLATLALCYVACDSGRTAGSSMETENSIALQVQLADGTPAARMDVIVRPDSYLSGASELGSDSIYQLHFETDKYGRVVLRDVPSGSYVIEARSDSLNLKGFENSWSAVLQPFLCRAWTTRSRWIPRVTLNLNRSRTAMLRLSHS